MEISMGGSSRLRQFLVGIAAGGALMVLGAAAGAQEITATLGGTVKDSGGASVPGATVTIVQSSTHATRSSTSNGSGAFFFNSLPIGTYTVSVELTGFKKYQVHDLILHVNDKANVNAVLEIGGMTDEVTVEAKSGGLQTETAEVSNLVGAAQMQDLPLNGRDFNQLVELVPGVESDNGKVGGGEGLFSDTAVSINGNLSNSNLYLVDGEYNLDSGANGNLLVTPSEDAIEEFKILRNNYSAEFGGATGGIVNVVTKSGGQQFHGTGFEFLRNDAFDATDYFLNATGQPKSKLKLNDFGFTLGGPAFIPGHYNADRKSDFFFVSYEAHRETRGQTVTDTVPTTRQRQGILDPTCTVTVGPCTVQATDPFEAVLNEPNVDPSLIDPNALAFFDRYPLPNANFAQNGFNWILSANKRSDNDQILARWDHYFGAKAILTLRYISMVQKLYGVGCELFGSCQDFPSVNTDWSWRGKNAIVKLTSTINAHLLNDFQVGYSSNALAYVTGASSDPTLASRTGFTYTELFPETTGSFPTLNPVEVFNGLGHGAPFDNRTDNFQFKDDVAYSFGSHNLRTGAFLRLNFKREPANGGSNFTAGTFSFNTFSDLLLGNIANYQEEQTQNNVFDHSRDLAFYAQDTWKVRKDLTLDYGLRWQWLAQVFSAQNNIANFRPQAYNPSQCSTAAFDQNGLVNPAQCNVLNGLVTALTPGVSQSTLDENLNGFEPRVGLAWRPRDTNRYVIRAGFGIFHGRDAVSQTSSLGRQPPFDAVATLNSITFAQLAPGQLSPFNSSLPQPPVALAALQQHYPSPESYQYSAGFQVDLGHEMTLELNYVGAHQVHIGENFNINQVLPQSQLQVANNSNNVNNCVSGCINPDLVRPYLGYNIINMNERVGSSRYNALQVFLSRRMAQGFEFQVAYTYSRNTSTAANQDTEASFQPVQDAYNPGANFALANQDQTHSLVLNYIWKLPFFSHSGGFTKAVLGGWEFVGIGTFRTGLPATVCLDRDIAGTGTQGYECQRPSLSGDPNLPASQRNLNQWFNTGAFTVPALGTFGNSPRNNVRLPGVNNWDLSVFKNFEIPWFGGAAAANTATVQFRVDLFNAFNHTQFSGVNLTLPASGPLNGFGAVTSARTPREIQVALKLIW
jgi:outer membrane receptor protein involved in Fe transport